MTIASKTNLEGKQSPRLDNVTALYVGVTYYDLFGVEDSKGDFIALFARNGGIRHGDRYGDWN